MSQAAFARKNSDATSGTAKASSRSVPADLRIGEPDDAYEREADRVADEVMAGGSSEMSWSLARVPIDAPLQRKCACGGAGEGECEDCRKGQRALQRKPDNRSAVDNAPLIIHQALRSPGQPLDPASRAFFEPRFGYDFTKVRVHADAKAAESAQAVGALAYTVARDIVLGPGPCQPGTAAERRLLAHELAHVVQQSNAPFISGAIDSPGDPGEREAERVALAVSAGRAADVRPSARTSLIQRQAGPTLTMPTFQSPFKRAPIGLFPPGKEPHLKLPGLGSRPAQRLGFALPPLSKLFFSPAQLASFATAGVPPNFLLTPVAPSATQAGNQAPGIFGRRLLPFQFQGGSKTQAGADISLTPGQPPAMEYWVAMFLDTDLGHVQLGVPIDVLHQPTAQVTLGVPLGRAPAGSSAAYAAAQIAITVLNLHLIELGRSDLLELGLGQLAVGEQAGIGQFQASGTAELHLTERFSILLSGGITITPEGEGVSAAPGPFNLNVVWYGP